MPRARYHFLQHLTLAGLGLWLSLAAKLKATEEPSPAPASFVQDDARLFEPAAIERMSRALTEIRRTTGESVYVATASYLENLSTRNPSQQLVERWLPDKPGVILTYNRGNGLPGVVVSPDFWRRHPADEIAKMLAETGHVLGQKDVAPEHRIQEAVTFVVGRIRQLDAERNMPHTAFSTVERRLAVAVATTIAVCGMIVWMVTRIRQKNSAARGGPFLFPEATVSTRLGAQFGASTGESSDPPRE